MRPQQMDYDYNIRGWLTQINDVDAFENYALPDCAINDEPTCPPVCDYTVKFPCVGGLSIIGIIVDGGQSMQLNPPYSFPIGCHDILTLELAIKDWLESNNYLYQSVLVYMEGNILNIQILGSEVVFNYVETAYLSFTSSGSRQKEYFIASNCEDREEEDICDICEMKGYPCERCPYSELQEPCITCETLGIDITVNCLPCETPTTRCEGCQNLGYGSCEDCPLTVRTIEPIRLEMAYNQSNATQAANAHLVHLRETARYYLHDGSTRTSSFDQMLVIGEGPFASGDLVHVMEIELPFMPIGNNTFTTVLNSIEQLVEAELEMAEVTDPAAQTAFSGAVIQALEAAWGGLTTEDDPVPYEPQSFNRDIFAMDLYYGEGNQYTGTPGQANGNISGITWGVNFGHKQTYGFSYDAINRLTSGTHRSQLTPEEWDNDNKYGMSATYDPAGNILTLGRNGVIGTCPLADGSAPFNFGEMDNLSYTYGTGNRLIAISESSNTDYGFKGGGGGISYDDNGNMTSVGYKGGTFQYNHLNLPHLFDAGGGDINWKYDAAGTKLQKDVVASDPDATYTKDYILGIEYKDDEVEAIYHSDGRAVLNEDGEFVYEYYIKDHLGNVRVVFSDQDNNGYIWPFGVVGGLLWNGESYYEEEGHEIVQESHYYPFGMGMDGSWSGVVNEPNNDYLYNGNERISDLELNFDDFNFRTYDASIGRFIQVDLLAEWAPEWTPYRFGFDNPVTYWDPLGLFETKREARRYRRKMRREARRKGEKYAGARIKKNKDGRYDVRSKGSDGYVTRNADGNLEYGATAYATNAIRQDYPNGWERFKNTNFLTGIAYGLLNDAWLVTQRINAFDTQTTHLSGDFASKKEYTMGLVNTAATAIPVARATVSVRAVTPQGVTVASRLNAAQFSKFFKGTVVARMHPVTRGRINRLVNKGVDQVNKRVETGSVLFMGTKTAGNAVNNE